MQEIVCSAWKLSVHVVEISWSCWWYPPHSPLYYVICKKFPITAFGKLLTSLLVLQFSGENISSSGWPVSAGRLSAGSGRGWRCRARRHDEQLLQTTLPPGAQDIYSLFNFNAARQNKALQFQELTNMKGLVPYWEKSSTLIFTDLVIGEEGNAVIHSHSANGKIVLQVASVVVGQVDHQVYVTLADQSRNTEDRNVEEMLFEVITFR